MGEEVKVTSTSSCHREAKTESRDEREPDERVAREPGGGGPVRHTQAVQQDTVG